MDHIFSALTNLFPELLSRSKKSPLLSEKINLSGITDIIIMSSNIDISVNCNTSLQNQYIIYASEMYSSLPAQVQFLKKDNKMSVTVTELCNDIENISIEFNFASALESLQIKTKSANLSINNCRIPDARLQTYTGDICVENHLNPCSFQLYSKNGDINQMKQYTKSPKSLCRCTTTNGDIVLQ